MLNLLVKKFSLSYVQYLIRLFRLKIIRSLIKKKIKRRYFKSIDYNRRYSYLRPSLEGIESYKTSCLVDEYYSEFENNFEYPFFQYISVVTNKVPEEIGRLPRTRHLEFNNRMLLNFFKMDSCNLYFFQLGFHLNDFYLQFKLERGFYVKILERFPNRYKKVKKKKINKYRRSCYELDICAKALNYAYKNAGFYYSGYYESQLSQFISFIIPRYLKRRINYYILADGGSGVVDVWDYIDFIQDRGLEFRLEFLNDIFLPSNKLEFISLYFPDNLKIQDNLIERNPYKYIFGMSYHCTEDEGVEKKNTEALVGDFNYCTDFSFKVYSLGLKQLLIRKTECLIFYKFLIFLTNDIFVFKSFEILKLSCFIEDLLYLKNLNVPAHLVKKDFYWRRTYINSRIFFISPIFFFYSYIFFLLNKPLIGFYLNKLKFFPTVYPKFIIFKYNFLIRFYLNWIFTLFFYRFFFFHRFYYFFLFYFIGRIYYGLNVFSVVKSIFLKFFFFNNIYKLLVRFIDFFRLLNLNNFLSNFFNFFFIVFSVKIRVKLKKKTPKNLKNFFLKISLKKFNIFYSFTVDSIYSFKYLETLSYKLNLIHVSLAYLTLKKITNSIDDYSYRTMELMTELVEEVDNNERYFIKHFTLFFLNYIDWNFNFNFVLNLLIKINKYFFKILSKRSNLSVINKIYVIGFRFNFFFNKIRLIYYAHIIEFSFLGGLFLRYLTAMNRQCCEFLKFYRCLWRLNESAEYRWWWIDEQDLNYSDYFDYIIFFRKYFKDFKKLSIPYSRFKTNIKLFYLFKKFNAFFEIILRKRNLFINNAKIFFFFKYYIYIWTLASAKIINFPIQINIRLQKKRKKLINFLKFYNIKCSDYSLCFNFKFNILIKLKFLNYFFNDFTYRNRFIEREGFLSFCRRNIYNEFLWSFFFRRIKDNFSIFNINLKLKKNLQVKEGILIDVFNFYWNYFLDMYDYHKISLRMSFFRGNYMQKSEIIHIILMSRINYYDVQISLRRDFVLFFLNKSFVLTREIFWSWLSSYCRLYSGRNQRIGWEKVYVITKGQKREMFHN